MSPLAQYDVRAFLNWQFDAAADPRESARLIDLLGRIDRAGSIAAAVRECGISYRNAWGLIEKWQLRFGQPLVQAERGSGSRLTAFAAKLVELDRNARRRLAPQLAAVEEQMRKGLADWREASGQTLRITASHDLGLLILKELMQSRGQRVELRFRGSLESLAAFARDRCDVAGFHCPAAPLGARVWERFRRYVKPRQQLILLLSQRTQGLMVRRGNPKALTAIADLRQPGVRFLNRQEGAGTRLLLDLLLQESGVDPAEIPGYGSEEHTHAAVAALIASGEADAGLGIEAAARRFGLDFVPLMQEYYFVACRKGRWQLAPMHAFASVLASAEFRRRAASLAGYDVTHCGESLSPEGMQKLLGRP